MSVKRIIPLLLALVLLASTTVIAEEALPLPREAVDLPAAETVIELPAPDPDAVVEPAFGPAGDLNDAPETPVSPMPVKTIRLKQDASATVYMGIPYRVAVPKGDAIQSIQTSDPAVASADTLGNLILSDVGQAKLTVATAIGAEYVLTLTVKPSPAPGDIQLKTGAKRVTLSWSPAKHATGYRVEASPDGNTWTGFKSVNANVTSANVTNAVTGTTWFRVVALLGDTDGGASESVSMLDPVTGVEVICEEEYYNGPTDRLNVVWEPSTGATAYAVYRASLPSGDYALVGTTKKLYYADTRDPDALYAYRVRPVWGSLDLDDLPLSDPVTLWTGYQNNVLPPKGLDSDAGIILVVNKKAQVTTAYVKDEKGRYTIPLRHMICTTGRVYERTRNGTYVIESRKGEWYTYPGERGDTIRWPTVYRSGYYFHSPLYNRNHSIRGSSVRQLGRRGSAGCVRLKVRDAEWVYHHCPNGTVVYICDGAAKDALKDRLYPKDVSVKGF